MRSQTVALNPHYFIRYKQRKNNLVYFCSKMSVNPIISWVFLKQGK
ncbi:hypothetical protein AVDCRST_MAG84-5737 [uncultured Microcoleus sp.]|uniref:Uncharacterized protein n=1 Tax=uncultured Microcoleus sp. TaxID=259945 RepID=A0A6J4NNK6_9CYAN|nr:hypothetical protein AVDCRST_MAG84-5737 [uncultured Microcoleus sp.]